MGAKPYKVSNEQVSDVSSHNGTLPIELFVFLKLVATTQQNFFFGKSECKEYEEDTFLFEQTLTIKVTSSVSQSLLV